MAAFVVGWSIALFAIGVLSVLSIPIVIARLPADHFVREHDRQDPAFAGWKGQLLRALRNAFGLLLIVAGIAMIVLPGQGVLSILLGLSLVDFPGKRRLLLSLMRLPRVRRVVSSIRRRAGKPPFDLESTQ